MLDIAAIRSRYERNLAWFDSVPWLKADVEALIQHAEAALVLAEAAKMLSAELRNELSDWSDSDAYMEMGKFEEIADRLDNVNGGK